MKKKLLIALLTAFCIVASTFGFTSVFANGTEGTAPINLATDANNWNRSNKASADLSVFDENGLTISEYG